MKMKKKIRYLFEAVFVYIFFTMFKMLGFRLSSKLGGFIARKIGTKLKVNNIAINNLNFVMPELTDEQKDKIINDMWDNLGRTVAELPNLQSITKENYTKYIKVTDYKYVTDAMKNNKQIFFFSCHSGNWEIIPKMASILGCEFVTTYRVANNLYVDKIIQKCRRGVCKDMIPKGKYGAKKIIGYLSNGSNLAMLTDQKMNDGIEVDFFDKPAMTAPAIAKFVLKYNAILIPSFTIRNKEKSEIIFFPPLETENKTVLEIMTEVNKFFEDRIRKNPGQWMWIHKRWSDTNFIPKSD